MVFCGKNTRQTLIRFVLMLKTRVVRKKKKNENENVSKEAFDTGSI